MENRHEKLHLFFDRIKILSFWQRLFGWKTIRELSYEAYNEFNSLLDLIDRLNRESDQSSNNFSLVKSENDRLKSDIQTLQGDFKTVKDDSDTYVAKISELRASIASKDETIRLTERKSIDQEKELSIFKLKNDQLTSRQSELENENTAFKENENSRIREHQNKVTVLTGEIERVSKERNTEKEKLHSEEIKRIENMKQIWGKHQEDTENAIKTICQKHTIEYVDKVPFKGSPDNTLKICDEFIIFDAKSPASDNLENFPTYIKNQTVSVKNR